MEWNKVKEILDQFEKDNPGYCVWVTIDKRGMYVNCDVYEDEEGSDYYNGRRMDVVSEESLLAELKAGKDFMYKLYNE